MFPLEMLSFGSKRREGLCCPHCQSELVIRHGSYREFNGICVRIATARSTTLTPLLVLAHAKIGLDKLLFAFYLFLRFDTSICQLDAGIDVLYRSLRRRVEQFARTLDAPAIDLVGSAEIDKVHVTAGLILMDEIK